MFFILSAAMRFRVASLAPLPCDGCGPHDCFVLRGEEDWWIDAARRRCLDCGNESRTAQVAVRRILVVIEARVHHEGRSECGKMLSTIREIVFCGPCPQTLAWRQKMDNHRKLRDFRNLVISGVAGD